MNNEKELDDILDQIYSNENETAQNNESTEEFSEIPDGEISFDSSVDEAKEAIENEDEEEEYNTDEDITLFPDDDSTPSQHTDSELYNPYIENLFSEPTSVDDEITKESEEAEDVQTDDTFEQKDDHELEITENAVEESVTVTESTATENKNPKKKEETTQRKIDAIFDFIELFVFTLAAVFIITSFFFKYSIVDGGSMNNTLQHQDKLLLYSFMYEPECGDVIVLEDHSTVLKKPIVKRVIAVGGQTVKITKNDIYVNGERLNETYVYTDDYRSIFGYEDQYRYSVIPSEALIDLVISMEEGVYYEIKVPEGELFVMGDHRNASNDSRDIGTVHEDSVIGKVVLRFYPFDSFGKID